MMSKMPLFFVVVVAIIVIAASFRYVQQRRENEAAPLMQKRVTVSNKREKVLNDRRSRQQTEIPAGSSMRYDVSFKPEQGGLEMHFRLDGAQYHALTVGDKGVLSYKGSRFVTFEAESLGQ